VVFDPSVTDHPDRSGRSQTAPNFADLAALEERVLAFITEWNAIAHPFAWTAKSFEKILAKTNAAIATAA
jgi:hypothetical protein